MVLGGISSSESQAGPVAPVAGPAEEISGGRSPLLPPVPLISVRTPVVSAKDADQVPPAPAWRPVETPPVGPPRMLLGQDLMAVLRYTTMIRNACAVRYQEDCLAIWHKGIQRGVLTKMDKACLYTADRMRLSQNRPQSFSGLFRISRFEPSPLRWCRICLCPSADCPRPCCGGQTKRTTSAGHSRSESRHSRDRVP